MNHLKQFTDGLEHGLREVERQWFKTMDDVGQEELVRLGIVAIAIIFLWPLLSCLAEFAVAHFQ
jgi:hypothetical protein